MNRDFRGSINQYLQDEIEIIKKLDINEINKVINQLEKTREQNASIYICGNGGSGSTASHFTSDFNKNVSMVTNKKYNFICLNDNIPSLLAYANDCGYEYVFVKQLEGKIKQEDLLFCISGSGNSKNIIMAANYARSIGVKIIGATGYDGGELYKLSDYHLHVPINNMQITEDLHLIFDHLMMWVLVYGGSR
jgi:D-sedoheptulose 7-phosphate isomerase